MGILDRIKPKKKQEKVAEEVNVLDLVKEPVSANPAAVAKATLAEKAATADKPAPLKEDTGRAYRILNSAHLSEKTNALSAINRYVFKVNAKANKIDVKKAVEKTFDVHVTAVNVVNVKGKMRRMGRKAGRTSDWKKAMITLKAGEKISGLTEGV